MKLHSSFSLTKALPIFHTLFPANLLEELESEILAPGNYERQATPGKLTEALIKAIIMRLSSQEEILKFCPSLGLSSHSALSYDLASPWFNKFSAELLVYQAVLKPTYEPNVVRHPRILLDTMPVLVQITQRGTSKKYNNVAKGCGVMCGFNLDTGPEQCPVHIHRIMRGGWNDTYQVRRVELIAQGPIYITDRGFYSLETMCRWRGEKVHFISRAKKQNLTYEVVRCLPTSPGRVGKVQIESDEIVMLGKPGSKHRSEVRLLKAWLSSGEDLWLVTDQYDLTAEQLLDAYSERGKIEVYHRFVKNSLGAAHLYSFDENGMESQIRVTVLVANLLYLWAARQLHDQGVLKTLDQVLETIRTSLGLPKLWKRNTVAQRRDKPEHNRRRLKPKNSNASAQPDH